ncbi:hypothetical protein AB5I41_00980 [Sphingomonas sp. MMS24-JH45]
MFAGLAVGESRIRGLLEGEDVLATAAAMREHGGQRGARGRRDVARPRRRRRRAAPARGRARHGQFGHLDTAADGGWSRAIRSRRRSSVTRACRNGRWRA